MDPGIEAALAAHGQPVEGLVELTWSPDDPHWVPIASVDALARAARLEVLRVPGNPIRSVGPLVGATRLRALVLADAPVEDLAPLARLPRLRELVLGGPDLPDLTPLAALDLVLTLVDPRPLTDGDLERPLDGVAGRLAEAGLADLAQRWLVGERDAVLARWSGGSCRRSVAWSWWTPPSRPAPTPTRSTCCTR
jgi:hypothetical protein